MSEEKPRFSLLEEATKITLQQRNEIDHTIWQALSLTGDMVDNPGPLEREVCNQFAVPTLDELTVDQLPAVHTWILLAWTMERLEWKTQSVYERQAELLRDQQALFVMANRMSALIASRFKSLVTVLLALALALPPAMAAPQPPVSFTTISPKLQLASLTYTASQDGQIIAKPYATSETDVLLRATATLEADPFPNVQDAELILKAVNYAGNFSVSVAVDRAFLEDCVDGFPMASLLKDNMRLDAAILTEIPGTNFSPVIYALATMDKAGDINKGPLLIYFGTLLGPKAFLARTPSEHPSRVPSLGESFGLIWQNGFPAVAKEVTQRQSNRQKVDDCIACLDTIKANAARVRDGKVIAAGAVASAAGVACAVVPIPVYQVICFVAAAAALIGTLKAIHAEYDEKIVAAKRGICAINRETGQSCQWER